MSRTAIYTGSFDPLTHGHLDVIRRSFALAGRLVVAVGVHHGKTPFLDTDTRLRLIADEVESLARAASASFDVATFDGLAVDAAHEHGATLIVRGIRNVTDFDYETGMASMNSRMAGDVETVFLAASPEVAFISSSLVRQIAAMGGDFMPFVPSAVAEVLTARSGN